MHTVCKITYVCKVTQWVYSRFVAKHPRCKITHFFSYSVGNDSEDRSYIFCGSFICVSVIKNCFHNLNILHLFEVLIRCLFCKKLRVTNNLVSLRVLLILKLILHSITFLNKYIFTVQI